MSEIHLFPTTIWSEPADSSNYSSVQLEIQKALTHIKDNNELDDVSYIYRDAGERKQDLDNTGYLISHQLIEHHDMKALKERIHIAVNKYVQYVEWTALANEPEPVNPDIAKGNWKIMNSWINIAEKGAKHDSHAHPGHTIAGVYYFKVSQDQGGICWNNPNPILYNSGFPEGRASPQSIGIIPNEGDILLFPAWLLHSTPENILDEERISIAFNVNWLPT